MNPTTANIKNNIFTKSLVTCLLLFSFLACKKEQPPTPITCEEGIYIGDFDLSESTLNFLPYPDSLRQIVFLDSASNEIVLDFRKDPIQVFRQENEQTCSVDTNQIILYTGDFENQKFYLESNAENIFIWGVLANSDWGIIRGNPPREYIYLLVDNLFVEADGSSVFILRNDEHIFKNQRLSQLDTFVINNQTFHDVYTYDNSDLYAPLNIHYQFYVNKTHGIVGMVNPETNVKLSFDRFEY